MRERGEREGERGGGRRGGGGRERGEGWGARDSELFLSMKTGIDKQRERERER